jgi:hypothetical protein
MGGEVKQDPAGLCWGRTGSQSLGRLILKKPAGQHERGLGPLWGAARPLPCL